MSEAMGIALFTFLAPSLLGTLLFGPWSRALHSARATAGGPLTPHQVRQRLLVLLWSTCLLGGVCAYWLTSSGIVD